MEWAGDIERNYGGDLIGTDLVGSTDVGQHRGLMKCPVHGGEEEKSRKSLA